MSVRLPSTVWFLLVWVGCFWLLLGSGILMTSARRTFSRMLSFLTKVVGSLLKSRLPAAQTRRYNSANNTSQSANCCGRDGSSHSLRCFARSPGETPHRW